MKKMLSIVTPCFNESENVEALYEEIKKVIGGMSDYAYEHIFIDNASTDGSYEILRNIARRALVFRSNFLPEFP